jgi:uncharacterized membrane protein
VAQPWENCHMSDQDHLAGRAVERWLRPGRRTSLMFSAAIGVIAGALAATFGSWIYAPAVGWDAMAIFFAATVWVGIWPMSAETTAARATREDPGRAVSDILILSASVASLGAVGIVLVGAHAAYGVAQGLLAGLGLLSVAVSWLTVHTIFMLRYALLYYLDPVGGVDFNSDERPCYRDFSYLALTIGMTFQVSDTDLKTTDVRAAALRHALLSYLFGSVILAAAVNLIAGLGTLYSSGARDVVQCDGMSAAGLVRPLCLKRISLRRSLVVPTVSSVFGPRYV